MMVVEWNQSLKMLLIVNCLQKLSNKELFLPTKDFAMRNKLKINLLQVALASLLEGFQKINLRNVSSSA